MKLKEYTHENMKLTGIMTEDMIKELGIPIEQTKIHGVVDSGYDTFTLYEVPAPYDKMDVYYGNLEGVYLFIPKYYFSPRAIQRFHLKPIEENDKKIIVCSWGIDEIKNGSFTFQYNRKNEEKYRLRLLTDPDFDPTDWELKKID